MLYVVALLGGVAGLAWELLWLHFTALSIGVSSQGAALTLVAFSIGLALGSELAGRWLSRHPGTSLLALWGALEIAIALCGQGLEPGFAVLADLDTSVWRSSPGVAPLVHLTGMLVLLTLPAACMGATIPVLAGVAKERGLSVGRLYAANVAGAALGIIAASFVFIPAVGVGITVSIASVIDVLIGAALLALASRARREVAEQGEPDERAEPTRPAVAALEPRVARVVVVCTGFATFALEVAWFRSLRAAYQATTDSFALVLFGVLLPLSVGGAVAPWLARRSRPSLGTILAAAALVVLVTTPVIERFDLVLVGLNDTNTYVHAVARRLLMALAVLGPSMVLIGVGLPWVLEATPQSRGVGLLYALNTVGATLGSLLAAWVLLPTIGFARTAWIAGAVLAIGAAVVDPRRRVVHLVVAGVGLAVAALGASEVGTMRVQTNLRQEHVVVASKEGPDATVSVIEHTDGSRHLVIDGFYASTVGAGSHYMPWMGHLPMLMHPEPERALVICFGTGQTANAVREEGPTALDIVDVNATVLAMGGHFPANEGVLDDPRVTPHVMDGRAWMRRTDAEYDVITLEPMPPTFAGSNALYSAEFYGLARDKLSADGVIAQWLPFHLVSPEESASVVAAFIQHFPESYLWIDTEGTGILIGRRAEGGPLFPGLTRNVERDLPSAEVVARLRYGPELLERYAQLGQVVTDDNQLLSYGWGRMLWWGQGDGELDTLRYQLALLEAVAAPGPVEQVVAEFLAKHPRPGSI